MHTIWRKVRYYSEGKIETEQSLHLSKGGKRAIDSVRNTLLRACMHCDSYCWQIEGRQLLAIYCRVRLKSQTDGTR